MWLRVFNVVIITRLLWCVKGCDIRKGYMMSLIALIIWEGMVFYFAQGFLKAFQSSEERDLEAFAGVVIATLVIIGLAILPFTEAFTPH